MLINNNAVIVIGGGITSLGIIRNIGRHGIDVLCLVEKIDLACKSRYCNEVIVESKLKLDPSFLLDSLIKISETYNYENFILFSTSDLFLQMLASHGHELPNKFLFNIPTQSTLDIVIEKFRFYTFLKGLNIPHPQSFFPKDQKDLDLFTKNLNFPMFLKPNKSHEFRARFNGRKGFTINNLSELREKFELAKRYSIQVIINEIIPGEANNHFFIDGYCDKDSQIKTIFTRRRIHMYPLDWGNSTSMVSIEPEQIQPALNDLTKLLKNLKYRGIFSAEVKFDYRDKLYKFIEINARSWWYNLFPSICGINIIKMAYDDLVNGHVENIDNFIKDKYHVYFWPEIKSVIHMIRQKEKKNSDLLQKVNFPISFPVFALDDIKPFLQRILDWTLKTFKFNR